MSWRAAYTALLCGALAVVVQNELVPLLAGHHLGLFTNGSDLNGYREGAVLAIHQKPLYAHEILPYVWFAYTPFAAVFFYPLTSVDFDSLKVLWFAISFGALVSTVWRCLTVLRYRPTVQLAVFSAGISLVAVDIEAIRATLWQGQINIILMAIILWDLTRPKGARFKGWSVGIAAGIKIKAIVFVPYLVVTRQWYAAITATITALISITIGWVILPDDSNEYWSHAVFQIGHIGSLTHPGNRSIGGILATIWAPSPMPTGLWFSCALIAFTVGLYAAWSASESGRILLAVTIVGLIECVVPPLAWGHHWVWFAPLFVLALDKAMRSDGPQKWKSVTVACGLMSGIFMWFSSWTHWETIRINLPLPMYEEATAAVFTHMPRIARLLTTGTPPVIYFITVVAVILGRKKYAKDIHGADPVDTPTATPVTQTVLTQD